MASSTAAFMSAQGTPAPIYVDTQHEDLVHDAQLDYYGCKLATASSGEYIAKGSIYMSSGNFRSYLSSLIHSS